MMRCDAPGCGDKISDLASFVAHNFRHVHEEMRKMTDQITDLTTADTAEAAAEQRVADAVSALATQQSTFLEDVKTALGHLGNNDQVTAIIGDINSRQVQLNAIADQVNQLAADEAAADPEAAPVATETGDPVAPVAE